MIRFLAGFSETNGTENLFKKSTFCRFSLDTYIFDGIPKLKMSNFNLVNVRYSI